MDWTTLSVSLSLALFLLFFFNAFTSLLCNVLFSIKQPFILSGLLSGGQSLPTCLVFTLL